MKKEGGARLKLNDETGEEKPQKTLFSKGVNGGGKEGGKKKGGSQLIFVFLRKGKKKQSI